MEKISKAAAKAMESVTGSRSKSVPSSNNPPPSAPDYEEGLEADKRAFSNALNEVRMTESAIEREMQQGGCLQKYTLIPDEAHYINGDAWLGGVDDRLVHCTNQNAVSGMAFADLEKQGVLAYGCLRLNMTPCCGFWRCFLYRKYKIGVKKNGQVQIANNFPEKKGGSLCFSNFCACVTCCSLGEFESTKRYEERLCSSTTTNDGSRIIKLEEGITQQREIIKASEIGAQRRGERPTVDIASDLIHEEYPFWSHWKEKDASAECSDNDNSPVEQTAAADDFHAECTDNPPVINIDPKNPPMAVAVPMER